MYASTESSRRRPAFVVSPAAYCERTGFVLVCDIEPEARGYPFEVALPPGRDGGGVILADRVRCLHARSWGLLRVRTMGDDVVLAVLARLATLVGLPDDRI